MSCASRCRPTDLKHPPRSIGIDAGPRVSNWHNPSAGGEKTSRQVSPRGEAKCLPAAGRRERSVRTRREPSAPATRPLRFFHETRNTAFSVARMVFVGTEALQSCFFGRNLLWVESDDAVAGNENLIRARRGRAGWRRQSHPSHDFSGIYETRDPSHGFSWARGASRREFRGFHETRDTRHETRLFSDPKHGFSVARWCSLVLKPFSLFFGRGMV